MRGDRRCVFPSRDGGRCGVRTQWGGALGGGRRPPRSVPAVSLPAGSRGPVSQSPAEILPRERETEVHEVYSEAFMEPTPSA